MICTSSEEPMFYCFAIQAWNTIWHNDSQSWQLAWETSLQYHYMSFASALVLVDIDVYAWYLLSNQSLPIWIISPNWTSEHHCPYFSAYTGKSYATWLPLLRLDSFRAFALSACGLFGHTREKLHNHTGYIVYINITINL